MFGGFTFMVNGNMAIGVTGDGKLMTRVGKEQNETALKLPHAKPRIFTGKPMTGFIFVDSEGVKSDMDLSFWIEMCLV